MNVRKRKAISPLITTLLLIAIAVAASVLTYSWVMSMVGSQSAQAQTQVRIDSVAWTIVSDVALKDKAILTIRNTGSIAAEIESISIRKNKAGETAYLQSYITANSVDIGSTLPLTWDSWLGAATLPAILPVPSDYITYSTSYVLRVTTRTGFYYEMVVTTPSS
jgi:flagellin-like protein